MPTALLRSDTLAPAGRLRGRGDELAAAAVAVDRVLDGHGGTVLIEGTRGSGRTALLTEVQALARRAGLPVHTCATRPPSPARPSHPVLDALRGTDFALDRAIIEQIAALPEPASWWRRELEDRLEQAAREQPLVITADDPGQAGEQVALALGSLAARLPGSPILWLVTCTPRGSASLASALRGIDHRRLRLGRLSERAVGQIIGDLVGAAPDPALLRLGSALAGRPSLLTEFLAGAVAERGVEVDNGCATLTRTAVPARFVATVRAVIDALPALSGQLLRMASIVGRPCSLDCLAVLLERPTPALMTALADALESGLLVEEGDRLAPAHAVVKDAIDGLLPPRARRRMCSDVVEVLLAHDELTPEVAVSLAEVAERGDSATLELLRAAAAALEHTAPADAVTVGLRALELAGPGDRHRAALIAETTKLLSAAGRLQDADALAHDALARTPDPRGAAQIRLGLAQSLLHRSCADAVQQCLVSLGTEDLEPGTRLALRLVLSLAQLQDGGFAEAAATQEANLGAARAADSPEAVVTALQVSSIVCLHRHDYEGGLRQAEAAEQLAAAAGPRSRRLSAWPEGWTALLHSAVGRSDEAVRRSEAGLRAAEQANRPAEAWAWSLCRSRVLLAAGRLGEARSHAVSALAMGERVGSGGADLSSAAYTAARVAVHTGDAAGLKAARAAVQTMLASPSLTHRRTGAWLAALLADADHAPEEAMHWLEETLDVLGTLTPTLATPQDPCDLLSLLRIVLRAGERRRGGGVVAEMERRADANPGFALFAALATHGRALLQADVVTLERTVVALDRWLGPVARAQATEDLAGITGSVERLEQARALYAAAGAERDVARVRRRLQERGARSAENPPQTTGWPSLTRSESVVVELVAAGATNRQAAARLYLSPHTVSSHLRHAFVKLGVRSRVELAAAHTEHMNR